MGKRARSYGRREGKVRELALPRLRVKRGKKSSRDAALAVFGQSLGSDNAWCQASLSCITTSRLYLIRKL